MRVAFAVFMAVFVVALFGVVAFIQNPYESDFRRVAVNVPVFHHFQVVGVQGKYLSGAGVGDENEAGGGGDVGPRPEAGIDVF